MRKLGQAIVFVLAVSLLLTACGRRSDLQAPRERDAERAQSQGGLSETRPDLQTPSEPEPSSGFILDKLI